MAALLVLGMTLMIGGDVVFRNLGIGGLPWSNEVSEYILYLVTLLSAPWLLRRGSAYPGRHSAAGAAGAAGLRARVGGRRQRFGLRTLFRGLRLARRRGQLCGGRGQPEDPGPAGVVDVGEPTRCLLLVAIEFVFRMHRLANSPIGPRADAVSAS